MPGDDLQFERPGNELRDNEYADEQLDDDELDDNASGTTVCQHCGAEVYEDVEECPACGTYLSPDTNAWSNRPLWWTLLGLAGLVAVLIALAEFLL